ncbi:MAG: WYL domain-containing protein [Muribaculaceae bacterium]|nr:WYL domain-containing protein [Muribaculaceae bacterium]
MAKNLINKYVWLVDTIYRYGPITLNEINERWLDQSMDERPIPLRTFHKWRIAAEDMFNLNIECKRRGGYHYFIENADDIEDNNLRNWLLNTLSVSNLLLDSHAIKNRILLEEMPSGHEHLAVILEAMKTDTPLRITYRAFSREQSYTFDVHPYCVKLFRQRWYLLAFSPELDEERIYAIDRIQGIDKLEGKTFSVPADFDPKAFFHDSYGIIVNTGGHVEDITLKVSAQQAPYLRSLPLHHSQREVKTDDKHSIFTLHLCPEFDFTQEILRNGDDVEVLEPKWLREEIKGIVKRMAKNYK